MSESISIAMTTYNGSRYIEEQLDSIFRQTRLPNELIICDDGSEDNTPELISKFSITAPFIVKFYQNKANIGYVNNFSKALSLCKSDIIFLCDQDDVWHLNKIERIMDVLSLNPDKHVIIHDLEYCDKDLRPIGQTKIRRIESYSDPMDKFVTGMATTVTKKFLNLCLPIPVSPYITHDNWIHRLARLLNLKIIVPEVLSLYRRHNDNATRLSKINELYINNNDITQNPTLISRIKSNTYTGLKKNISLLQELSNWLEINSKEIESLGFASEDFIINLLKELKYKIFINQKREKVISKDRINRIIPTLNNLIMGYYKEFNGTISALKDIFFN